MGFQEWYPGRIQGAGAAEEKIDVDNANNVNMSEEDKNVNKNIR